MNLTIAEAENIARKSLHIMIAPRSESLSPLVLVIEDEPLLRLDAVQMLEDAGYHTLEAGNADEAIALLEDRKDIRFVFSDVQMPGSMDGLKLAWAIRDRWPPIEMILTSGQKKPTADDLPERVRFLPKPYSSTKLLGTLRELA
jgi:CheY-like chemotaxis protein